MKRFQVFVLILAGLTLFATTAAAVNPQQIAEAALNSLGPGGKTLAGPALTHVLYGVPLDAFNSTTDLDACATAVLVSGGQVSFSLRNGATLKAGDNVDSTAITRGICGDAVRQLRLQCSGTPGTDCTVVWRIDQK